MLSTLSCNNDRQIDRLHYIDYITFGNYINDQNNMRERHAWNKTGADLKNVGKFMK